MQVTVPDAADINKRGIDSGFDVCHLAEINIPYFCRIARLPDADGRYFAVFDDRISFFPCFHVDDD